MSDAAKRSVLILLSVLVIATAGCGGATTRLFTKPIAESPYVTYQEWGPNRNIAVMPFLNLTKDAEAGAKCRELFIAETYISGAFEDIVDEGEMIEVMRKLKMREGDALGKDAIKTLGDNLGVQALIFGTVQEYTERGTKPALFAVSLRMVDVETGEILWLGNSSKEGGGSVLEALGLSDGPVIIDVARDVVSGLIDDMASEVLDRKVEGKAASEVAKIRKPKKIASPLPDENAAPEAKEKQAGISPSPAVKATSAGMAAAPAGMGMAASPALGGK